MSLKLRISSASQSLIRKENGGEGVSNVDFVVVVASRTESKKIRKILKNRYENGFDSRSRAFAVFALPAIITTNITMRAKEETKKIFF